LREKTRGFWIYSAPAIFYGLIIVIATGTPGQYLPDVDIFGADKIVHFAMHFVFGMLIHRALLFQSKADRIRAHSLLITVLFVIVFGILIEWYQNLIPGRFASVYDGIANILGALGYALIYTAGLWRIWPEKRIRYMRN
jgi:VanZ family protein